MSTINWVITKYRDPNLTGTWVHHSNPNFRGIHLSRCVDDSNRDHVATDDRVYYYYGATKTFNTPAVPAEMQQVLIRAWRDYFPVSDKNSPH